MIKLDLTCLRHINFKWELSYNDGILYAKQYKTIPILSNQLVSIYKKKESE